MMGPSSQLSDHIFLRKGVIPSDICDNIVSDITNRSWQKHTWYDKAKNNSYSEENKELSMLFPVASLQDKLNPFVIDSINKYQEREKYVNGNDNTSVLAYQYSNIKFNRYEEGQMMQLHHDHISDLFDGNTKGIPVASMIINFNDGYSGGDLVFWDDYVIPLEKGDIVMFPSLYLYPHKVTELQSGIRYSGACWIW